MHRKRFYGVLILIGVLTALIACAKPPTEEINAANSALDRAERNADVRQYAPESLARARNLVDRMKAAVEDKEYENAKSLALEAVSAAEKAITDAAAAKEKARSDASSAISSAKALLSEVEQSLAGARNVARIGLDFTATGRDISAASQQVGAAESDFAGAAYATAQTKAQNARSSLAEIQRRIAQAVQAATRRK